MGRKRGARRKAAGTRAPVPGKARPNARWPGDLLPDQHACGRRLGILNIADAVPRKCLAAISDMSICGRRVAREPAGLIERRGKPGRIVSDRAIGTPLVRETMARGTEPTSTAILTFARKRRIAWHHITPGKPMQDGFMENFNGRRRDEILSKTMFWNMAPARAVILAFAAAFNEARPHPARRRH